MILFADAGSTKTHWAIKPQCGAAEEFFSAGINPSTMAPEAVAAIVAEAFAPRRVALAAVDCVCYYGAGCRDEVTNSLIRSAIAPYVAPDAHIEVASDAVGAARALFGSGTGVAAILGTGANAMLVEDGRITDRIPPLGFILGDEGSGAWLGRQLVNAVFKRQLPSELIAEFHRLYPYTEAEIIAAVYRGEAPKGYRSDRPFLPARFLASFAPFLKQHIQVPEIAAIVTEGFDLFVRRNVLPLLATHPHIRTVGFVGSIACEFSALLLPVLAAHSLAHGPLLRAPLSALL